MHRGNKLHVSGPPALGFVVCPVTQVYPGGNSINAHGEQEQGLLHVTALSVHKGKKGKWATTFHVHQQRHFVLVPVSMRKLTGSFKKRAVHT